MPTARSKRRPTTVNGALRTIGQLNKQILQTKSLGQPTGDLEDMRNVALQTISSEMNIQYYVTATGEMRINTAGGTPLLDTDVHELSYTAKSVVTDAMDFNTLPGIIVGGKSIKGEITSGNIGGLIAMRDKTLPNAQAGVGHAGDRPDRALSTIIYGTGTTMPAPSTLNGATNLVGTDPLTGTGTMRIASVDDKGKILGFLDIDLTTVTTAQDLVDAINTAPLPNSGVTASLDPAGGLVLTAPAGQGVAVTGMDATSQIGGQGVAQYFGQALLTGTSASTIEVRRDIVAAPKPARQFPPEHINATLAVGDIGLSYSSAFVQSIVDLLGDPAELSPQAAIWGRSAPISPIMPPPSSRRSRPPLMTPTSASMTRIPASRR